MEELLIGGSLPERTEVEIEAVDLSQYDQLLREASEEAACEPALN